jgi:thiamine-phosphate pyrophosphorylase
VARNRPPPRLLAISDGQAPAARQSRRPQAELTRLADFVTWVRGLERAGIDGLQLREKQLGDRALFELARTARRHFGGTLLINGRADIARAARADGVHLPADGVPIALLRAAFGDALLIGRSTHSVGEILQARAEGADYVTFGPVWATPSKRRLGAPQGLRGLRAAAAVELPVLALGGVTAQRAERAHRAGAWGVAGIRLFAPGADLEARAARVAAALRNAHRAGVR